MSDGTTQGPAGSRLSRRALLRGVLGAAGAAFVLGGRASAAPTAPATSPRVRAQGGGDTRILLPADFEEIRAKIAAPGWALDAFNALKRSADGLVGDRPPIPERGGGWFHAGGEGYEITRVHNRLAEGVRTLGLLYRLTDDPAYAAAAREILLGYAARYQAYELHDTQGRTGPAARSGGKVLSQGLDEAIWLAALAFGYDLVRDPLSDADRETIARGVLRPAADLLLSYDAGRHNFQSYFNLGIGLAGFALGDASYVHHAIGKPDSGLLYQLSPGASFTSDGFWYEGSAHYHFYALEAIVGLAEAAQRNGYDPYAAPALRGAFDFPLAYADAEGRLPAFNDGPPASLYDANRARLYEIGFRRYGDPRYAELLAKAGRGSGIHGLLYGVPVLPRTEPFSPGLGGSALLADRTVPVLRTGAGANRLQLAVNGMSYVGAHTQPAQLEIELTAGPHRLVPAPASIKYADPLHAGWYRQTVSHSTVVVGGKSQERGQPVEVVAFHAGAVFQAARLRTTSAYPGAVLDRTVLLTDAGLVDLFQVRAPAATTLDWALHHTGQFSTEVALLPRRAPPLPGYQELEEVQEGRRDDWWRAGWVLPDNTGVLLWVAGEPGTTILTGLGTIGGPDQNNDPKPVSTLIVRREAAATTFVAVLLTGYVGEGEVAAATGPPRRRARHGRRGDRAPDPGAARRLRRAAGARPWHVPDRRARGRRRAGRRRAPGRHTRSGPRSPERPAACICIRLMLEVVRSSRHAFSRRDSRRCPGTSRRGPGQDRRFAHREPRRGRCRRAGRGSVVGRDRASNL